MLSQTTLMSTVVSHYIITLEATVPQTSSYTDRIHFVTKSGRTNITLAIIIYKSKTSSTGLCGILWHENKAQKVGKRRTGRNNETN